MALLMGALRGVQLRPGMQPHGARWASENAIQRCEESGAVLPYWFFEPQYLLEDQEGTSSRVRSRLSSLMIYL